MLSLGWAFGVALLMAIQQGYVAEPAGGNHQEMGKHHLQARARNVVGQKDSSPPCVRNICPLSLRGRSEESNYGSGQKDSISAEAHDQVPSPHQAEPGATENKPRIPGTHQTAPINCGDGTKPPCGQSRPEADKPRFPGTHQTAPIRCGDGTKPPCGQTHPEADTPPRFPGTHQTAPINCGDGTKPPCGGQARPTLSFPDPHQTAPILCPDGSKPPCGLAAHPAQSDSPKHFPGTHQTAPIRCGDGSKPPCGNLRSVVAFPGTHPAPCGDDIPAPCDPMQPETLIPEATDDCGRGDGIVGPCVITDPGREPPHPDLLPHPTVPNTCADGSKAPCTHNTQSPHLGSNFPGTHQTAPVTCGDGNKPPCHSNPKAY